MTFKRILCPTDFSPGSHHALQLAARIARGANAELVIAHAWYVAPSIAVGEHAFRPNVTSPVEDEARRGLEAAARDAAAAGVAGVSVQLLSGAPWAAIVELLEQHPFDLCVMGTHGRTGLSRILLGSVAEKVVRHSPCSVLAAHPADDAEAFRHVLVPTDFSESAEYAATLAARLVEKDGAITLAHVIELPVAYSGDVPAPGFEREVDERGAAILDDAVQRLQQATSARVERRVRIGFPGAQTLALLDDDRTIDLVVMGSQGRTGIKRALVGSVAEKLVRHARCPVLVARKRS